jgi:hypothetical protein
MMYRGSTLLLFGVLTVSTAAIAGQTKDPTTYSAAARSSLHAPLAVNGHKHQRPRCEGPGSGELFVDNFDGPSLNPDWQAFLPDAPYRYLSVPAVYLGASNHTFDTLDSSSVIRLHNILDNTQRRGWSSSTVFAADAPIVYEARFNTMVQSAETGIDELLELWLLDADNPERHDLVALSTPGYGVGRIFTAGSSITGQGLDTFFEFSNNTWYRMVIRGSQTEEVTASIYDDARTTELISIGFGHDLSAYPAGFRIGISQSMGFPDAPYPTDAAVDWVRLSGHPQPATVVIGTCDSEVPNPIFPSGCAITDLIAECDTEQQHRERFLFCVARLTRDLSNAGVINRQQKRAIRECAVASEAP